MHFEPSEWRATGLGNQGNPNDLALNGQDSNGTVWSICIMNMILHNITRFTIENGDTLEDPLILDCPRGCNSRGARHHARRTGCPRGSDDRSRLDFSAPEARIYGRDRGRVIDLSDTAGPPRRGAKNLVNFGRYAVRGDRAACRNQPRTRAQLALEQDGYGR